MNEKLQEIIDERHKEYGEYQDVCLQTKWLKRYIFFDQIIKEGNESYILPMNLYDKWNSSKQKAIVEASMNMGRTMMALKAIRSLSATTNFEDCILDFINYARLTLEVFDLQNITDIYIHFSESLFNPLLNTLFDEGIDKINPSEIGFLVDSKKFKQEYEKFLERI
jgi:hypothetical protein